MSFADSFSFFVTIVAIALAPGPVFLMLMARAASSDARGAVWFGIGYGLGGLLIVSLVCAGLGAWFTEVPEIIAYSKYVMLGYIAWLARDIWKGKFDLNAQTVATRRAVFPSLCGGVMTCAISPYMMVLFPLLVPELMDITEIQMPEFLIVGALTFAALVFGSGLIIGFAARLRRFVTAPERARRLNQVLAVLLVVAGGSMALA